MIKSILSIDGFTKTFPNNEAARIYYENLRWHGKPTCPNCHNNTRQTPRKGNRAGYYICNFCKLEYTVRTGTIMARSHIPLRKWAFGKYSMIDSRKGYSSAQLARSLDITQRSALFLQHRIREACLDKNPPLLKGEVEADEAYIGGKEANKHASKKLKLGRGTIGKTAVLGIRERDGNTYATVLKDNSAKTIQAELKKRIDKNATLNTDEHGAYIGVPFNHKVVNHSAKQFVDGKAHTNSIESVWALLKRGHYGVYHKISKKHLPRYLAEFLFRLNQGNAKRPTLDRINSLIDMTKGKRLTYNALIHGKSKPLSESKELYAKFQKVLNMGLYI